MRDRADPEQAAQARLAVESGRVTGKTVLTMD